MTNTDRLSPHYFIDWQRKYRPSHSEAVEIIRRAHEAVKHIASLDDKVTCRLAVFEVDKHGLDEARIEVEATACVPAGCSDADYHQVR